MASKVTLAFLPRKRPAILHHVYMDLNPTLSLAVADALIRVPLRWAGRANLFILSFCIIDLYAHQYSILTFKLMINEVFIGFIAVTIIVYNKLLVIIDIIIINYSFINIYSQFLMLFLLSHNIFIIIIIIIINYNNYFITFS